MAIYWNERAGTPWQQRMMEIPGMSEKPPVLPLLRRLSIHGAPEDKRQREGTPALVPPVIRDSPESPDSEADQECFSDTPISPSFPHLPIPSARGRLDSRTQLLAGGSNPVNPDLFVVDLSSDDDEGTSGRLGSPKAASSFQQQSRFSSDVVKPAAAHGSHQPVEKIVLRVDMPPLVTPAAASASWDDVGRPERVLVPDAYADSETREKMEKVVQKVAEATMDMSLEGACVFLKKAAQNTRLAPCHVKAAVRRVSEISKQFASRVDFQWYAIFLKGPQAVELN